MESVLLIVHVIIALGIVGLIMLQQGKGAEMGASFGAGASQTVFGAAGSSNLFSKMTALLVTAFFITSIVLAILSKESIETSEVEIPGVEEVVPEEISVEASANTDDIPEVLPEAESFETEALNVVEEISEEAEGLPEAVEAEVLEEVEEAPAN